MSVNFLERVGVVQKEMDELVAPAQNKSDCAIGLIGLGLEMHFDWELCKKAYKEAVAATEALVPEAASLLADAEPVQTKDDVLAMLNNYKSKGMTGLIIYHASFIDGAVALAVATWLKDNNMPVLSWAHTEMTGGNLRANRFCSQNFMLNVFNNMQIKYSWVFEDIGTENLNQALSRYCRSLLAKSRLNQGKLLMIGGMRVPGFYDCELNEMSIARHFGLSIDRVDLEELWQHGDKFTEEQINPIVQKLISSELCDENEVKENELYLSVRFALAIADYTRSGGYLGIALKNWPELFDRYGIAGDGAGGLVQDLGIPVADESDMGGLLTMVTFNELTEGAGLPTLMDLSYLNANDNKVGMWHCGGTATRLMRRGTKFQMRNHSILDNFDEESSCGMMLEFLQETGPITVAKYQYPHASFVMAFEGDIVDSEMRYRGSYGEVDPKNCTTKSVINTVLTNGLDHHWIVARGHLLEDLREFNHWIGVDELPILDSVTSGRSQPKNMNF
ncbi:L-fucose/L-arabinose isomerase family protein [Agaribacterium haliotis]|uniref:L-fucose/L-arabinose isomerase family protein n=1 Tax=Agaribacterium haliotis TaxID=2013869 RepID=UPI000BB53F9C|nr:hypothetical protein [Agaribacterium haliotis]